MESYHGETIFAILESPPASLLLVCFCKLLLALGAIIPFDSQTDNASADCRSLAVSTQLLDVAYHLFNKIVFHFTPWDYGIYYDIETVKLYTNIAKT